MTQEEKAKRYDVALENAKHYHSEMGDDIKCVLEECFSELRESEDERIRKDLLDFCKTASTGQTSILVKDKNQWFDWIAWLERQDEKDKLNTMLDDSLSRETKESWNKFLDEQKPVWSREDEQNLNAALGYINDEHLCRWLKDAIHVKYDNPAWSEEDERILRTIISDGIRGAEFDMVQVDWLKSLKERYIWKPSDEQIKVCKEVYADLLSAKGFDLDTINSELNRLEEDLKKLKEIKL